MNGINLIRTDIRAKAQWLYGTQSRHACIKALLTDGTAAMILYRLMQTAEHARLPPLAMLCNKILGICGGCSIGRGAQFGPRFVLIHSLGVVINGAVRGGAGTHIEHQVTIGAEQGQSPTLGDDVFIGAGAKILGPVHIGNHAKIGANAVVLQDVPDHATAVGIPARIIARTGAQDAPV